MDPHAGKLVLNGSPSQYARLLSAPDAAAARVDGRTPEELHAFAVQVARLVNFFALDDRVDGDWAAFFATDARALAASLSAAAPAAAEEVVAAQARRALEADDPASREALLRGLFAAVHGVARQADGWLRAARSLSGGTARRTERRLAAAVRDRLAPALRRLHAWHDEAVRAGMLSGDGAALDDGGFSPEWRTEGGRADGSLFAGAGEGGRMDAAVARLAELFGGAADALASVRGAAEGLAEAAPPGMQKPQVALFDAFVRLFATAQASLNALVPRYREFYYCRVLREPERGPVPDRVYLAFALGADATGPAPVPRGTLFSAGDDADGRALLYAAERGLAVTPAALARVRMLRAVRGPLIVRHVPAHDAPFVTVAVPAPGTEVREGEPPAGACRIIILPRPSPLAVQQLLASRLVGAQGEAGGAEIAGAGGWPTFGPGEPGTMGALVTEPAELGFAVASPELRLTGGRRFVAVAFRGVSLEALGRVQVLAAATGLGIWQALARLLDAAFVLDLSTGAGWLPVERYGATATPPPPQSLETTFTLGFELPASVVPIVPLWEGADPPPPPPPPGTREAVNPAPGLPTLRAWVRPGPVLVSGPAGTATIHPLPFLDELQVRVVNVRTWVWGLADVQVANTDGPVDASAPFPVFGGTPVAGSYLELRSAELFRKVPTELTVTVHWLGLPPNTDGFAGWYRDYTVGLDGTPQPGLFDNATFQGRWRVVQPGAWTVAGVDDGVKVPYEPVSLFRTRAEPVLPPPEPQVCAPPPPAAAGTLCTATRFEAIAVAPVVPVPPYPPAGSALRLELSNPSYAFGNDLYAVNVLNAVMEEIPDADACAAACQAAWQPLLDASTTLAACATPCVPAHPPDPAPCVACVESVRDALVAAGLAALLRAVESEAARELARAITWLAAEHRPAALRALWRDGEDASRPPRPWVAMAEGALALQLCLDEPGGPTEACLAECGAVLDRVYASGVEQCITDCARPRALRYPNPPWLPMAERVTVDYSARARIHPGRAGGAGGLFHLTPFGGWARVDAKDATLLAPLAEGASLLLGFGGLEAAQALPLLFQMEARGGGSPPAPAGTVAWSALDGDAWQPLPPSAVPVDGTHGLRNSGIVALEVPAGAAGGTRLPGPERWLRASVAADEDGFPWTVSILPHALTAVWQDPGGGAGVHLAQPLPAGTITSAVEELPGIGEIVQPMPSFGGRPPETAETYPVRLGERLRHKERAVQPWDYERLVLERFPQLWMARALCARDAAGAAPGSTLVVVVAGPEGNESADATVPRAPGALLAAVQEFLAGRASPFAGIQVVNPVYVRVRVEAKVVFRAGPEGGDIDRLNRELIAYLSPWFYDAQRAARQGRYAFEPDVSEFIQTRPYVRALLSLALAFDPPVAPLEWYFLTSADAHVIHGSILDEDE